MPEPHLLELLPRDAGLVVHLLLANPPVARPEPEAQPGQVPPLDLADVARDQVVVEQMQGCPILQQERGGRRGTLRRLLHAPHGRPSRRSRRLVDRAQPAVLSRPAGAARLPPDRRGRGRTGRDDLVHRRGPARGSPCRGGAPSGGGGERGETIWYIGGSGSSIGLREAQSQAAEPYDRYRVGLHHLAFEASSRAGVDERAKWLRNQGAAIESEPQEYGYMPGYYAVFFFDPDGIKLEILHVPGLAA